MKVGPPRSEKGRQPGLCDSPSKGTEIFFVASWCIEVMEGKEVLSILIDIG